MTGAARAPAQRLDALRGLDAVQPWHAPVEKHDLVGLAGAPRLAHGLDGCLTRRSIGARKLMP